jgi:hypothetical protein
MIRGKEIVFIILGVVLLFLCDYFLNRSPSTRLFLEFISRKTRLLQWIFEALAFLTSLNYQKSLEAFDDITEKTIKASILNVIAWSVFWIYWSIFNAIAYNSYYLQSTAVFVLSFSVAVVPGILVLVFTLFVRRSELRDFKKFNVVTKDEKGFYVGKYKSLGLVYYSGLYGILSMPVYLIARFILKYFLQ